MDIKQNPFSLYDFLGYLIPGSIFYYLLLFSIYISYYGDNKVLTLLTYLGKIEFILPFILLSYLTGHILSYLSATTIERYSILTAGYPSAYMHCVEPIYYFEILSQNKIRKIAVFVYRLFIAILILPISLFDLLFGQLLKLRNYYYKPLDQKLAKIIWAKVDQFTKNEMGLIEISPSEKFDYFRCIAHYVLEHAKAHQTKFQNYIALYGFTRTCSFIMIILFWTIWGFYICGNVWIPNTIILSIIFIVLSLILFLAFIKFFRRYTLEALMALCVIYPSHNDAQHALAPDGSTGVEKSRRQPRFPRKTAGEKRYNYHRNK